MTSKPVPGVPVNCYRRRRPKRQRLIKQEDCTGVSLPPVLSAFFVHGSGCLHPSPNRKGKVLPSAYAHLPGNHEAGNDAESDLREGKPEPVDALVEHWIDHFKNAVKQTRPHEGSDEASQQNWAARKHRKRCAVE